LLLQSGVDLFAQDKTSVYYLSIGSGHYSFHSLQPAGDSSLHLPEAINSARVMSAAFENTPRVRELSIPRYLPKRRSKRTLIAY
jgi:hypothetical protein